MWTASLVNTRGNKNGVDTTELKEHGFSWNWDASTSITVVFNEWPLRLSRKTSVPPSPAALTCNHGSNFIALDLAAKKVLKPSDVFKKKKKKKKKAGL